MKVLEQAVQFKPVTIIPESPEELALVNAMFALCGARQQPAQQPKVAKVEVTPKVTTPAKFAAGKTRKGYTKAGVHNFGPRQAKAKEYYERVGAIIGSMLTASRTKEDIAKELNSLGIKTPTDKVWNAAYVGNFATYYKIKAN